MKAPSATRPASPFVELTITLLVPAFILMQLSGEARLGPAGALIAALAFPLGWGVREYLRVRELNLLAVLGFVSVLLTGGIGLLALDPRWLAIKEAAIPALLGVITVGSVLVRRPLVRVLLFNPAIVNVDRIREALAARNSEVDFERKLAWATGLLAASFLFSAVMNYLLARWIVTSPAGTEAFNAELGRLTLISYPVIALPSMLIVMLALYYLVRSLRQLAGLTLSDILHSTQG